MSTPIERAIYEIAAKDAAWPVLPRILVDMQTGEITSITKYAADIFGYEQDELPGIILEELLPDSIRETHARWRKDAKVPLTRLMGAGRKVTGLRKDGNTFPAHVLLTEVDVLDKQIGIAFVVDLTGVVQ